MKMNRVDFKEVDKIVCSEYSQLSLCQVNEKALIWISNFLELYYEFVRKGLWECTTLKEHRNEMYQDLLSTITDANSKFYQHIEECFNCDMFSQSMMRLINDCFKLQICVNEDTRSK